MSEKFGHKVPRRTCPVVKNRYYLNNAGTALELELRVSRQGTNRAKSAKRPWPVTSMSRPQLAYFLVIDVVTAVWGLAAVGTSSWSLHLTGVLVLLVVLAIGFEEGARRAARLQLRLSADLKRNMVSVWAVAGAVALPAASAVALMTTVLIYVWFRQQRPAGQPLVRKWFNGSTEILGCLIAGAVLRDGNHFWSDAPWAVAGALSVIVAIALYTVINRSLVTLALVGFGVRGQDLLGSRDDNMIELATLCLGGLVALAILHQPWLTVLVVAPMVTLQRGALVRELEAAAMTDAKTGLLNAVAWEQLASRELARADREDYELAILIIDIDRFKRVNDRYGHLVGDKVLNSIAKSMTSSVREYDGLGRFGGEEFVAVLPEADEIAALVVAERVRSRINQITVSALVDGIDESPECLSVSIGVACFRNDGLEIIELLHAADQALYRAKSNGRNQVQVARRGDGIPEPVTS